MHMDIEARVRRAEELFHEGYNCSQSVLLAFADLTGVDEALLEKISIGLGGGVGRLREVCGAVSGMAMVAGFICDRCGCGDGSASGGSAGVADSDGSGGGVSVGGVSGDAVSAGGLRTGADGGVSVGGVSGDGVSVGSVSGGEVSASGVSGDGVSASGLRTDAGIRRAEQKKLAYSLVQELAGKFREENGSIVCHDLLNLRVNAAKAARDGKASGVDGAVGTSDSADVLGSSGASGAAGASGVDVVAGTDGGVVSSAGIGVPDAAGTDGGTKSGGLAGPSAYSPVPQERNEAYYKARPCQKLVGCSARIIAEYIAKNY